MHLTFSPGLGPPGKRGRRGRDGDPGEFVSTACVRFDTDGLAQWPAN